VFRGHTTAEVLRRLPRLLLGLALMATGISAMVRVNLGLSPWDVLHQGITLHTGIPIGTVTILVGLLVMIAWIPLHERIGIGSLLNVVLIGVFVDLELAWFATAPTNLGVRWTLVVLGPLVIGLGSGLYISTDLGPGPRDGVMTGLAARGHPTWAVRAAIELTALGVGWLLGGDVGFGTIWFALTIGPLVHFFLDRFALDAAEPATVTGFE
jgi:uncharacterized membrane protein YczE